MAGADDLSLLLTRTLDAPREVVFKAWTDPDVIARWVGPPGVTASVKEMAVRPGGRYRIAFATPNGPMVVGGRYRAVEVPDRLEYSWAWEEDGGSHRAGHESTVTITLRAVGNRTELTLRHEPLETTESRDDHGLGWAGSLDKLATLLAAKM
jgi:uncharacterized protein YndB with AHSA1/START domain